MPLITLNATRIYVGESIHIIGACRTVGTVTRLYADSVFTSISDSVIPAPSPTIPANFTVELQASWEKAKRSGAEDQVSRATRFPVLNSWKRPFEALLYTIVRIFEVETARSRPTSTANDVTQTLTMATSVDFKENPDAQRIYFVAAGITASAISSLLSLLSLLSGFTGVSVLARCIKAAMDYLSVSMPSHVTKR